MDILKKANDFFKRGDYVTAYKFYKEAEKKYGRNIINYNLTKCEAYLCDVKNDKNCIESSFLNEYFDHIYVVNLKHKIADRLKVAKHLTEHGIKFEIFEATNGYEGEPLEKYQQYIQRKLGDLKRFQEHGEREIQRGSKFIESAGAVGYIFTYLRILKDAKTKGYQRFLILEDDVLLIKNFEYKLKNFIDSIEKNWKILQLGASQYGWGSIDIAKAEMDAFYLPRIMETKGSFAIAFDSSIIDELIEAQSAFEAPFDHLPMEEQYEKYLGKCFVAFPNIVMPDVSESTIRGKRCQYTHGANMKWKIELFDYPLDLPSISIIISGVDNLKYFSSFSKANDLPFNLRLYFNTCDGLRPLHNIELLETYKDDVYEVPDNCSLHESDYIVSIDKNDVLSEEHIVHFIEFKTNIRKENVTPLREINNFPIKVKPGRVSVIMPTYKRPKNLANALASVIAQDYHDIEMIVVSDNGNDSEFNEETRRIVSSFEGRNPNCKVILIEHSINRNGAAARNTGILHSSGEYICFLDDDDIYLDGRISKSVAKLEATRKNVGAVYCGFLGWNSPENDLNRYKTGDLTLEILLLDYKKHYLHTNTATYKREAVLAINGFDESYKRHQDLEFNLRFFEKYTIDAVEECMVRLNPEPSDISNKVFNKNMVDLKTKFLHQFEYIISSYDLENQKRIHELHLNEVMRYIDTADTLKDLYKNNYRDYTAQIMYKLYENF